MARREPPPQSPVLYVFGETGRPDVVKIGTCSKGGVDRFKEGFCTNPRGLDVIAIWRCRDVGAMRVAERLAHQGLCRLADASGIEWFRLDRSEVIPRIQSRCSFGAPDFAGDTTPFDTFALYNGAPYDMLRELKDVYKSIQLQRRIWIHTESEEDGYRKISHNTWWHAKRSTSSNEKPLTYNTRQVQPYGCFEIPLDTTSPNWEENCANKNCQIEEIWQELVQQYGADLPPALRCGWSTVSVFELEKAIIGRGLRRIELNPNNPPPGTKDFVRKYGTNR